MTGQRPGATALARAQQRRLRGQRAELAVVDYLVARGFTILETNTRVGHLEIDIVARQEALVAIVEVRTRGHGSFTSALESLGVKKRARLILAAERLWSERLEPMAGVERVRIDVAAVTFRGLETLVDYVEAAIVA